MREDPDSENTGQQDGIYNLRSSLNDLLIDARGIQASNLCYYHDREGKYIPQAYPWLEEKYRVRGQDVLDEINRAIGTNKAKTPDDQPCVEVKRCSFQPGEEDLSENAPLGVFATCDPRRRTLTAREPREVNLESSPLEATPLTFALATRSLPGWFSSSYFVAAAVLFTWIRGCGRNICSYHFRF